MRSLVAGGRLDGTEIVEATRSSEPGAFELALLLCHASRIERALLREVRRTVAAHLGADAEADLWNSALAAIRGIDGLTLRTDVLDPLRSTAQAMMAAGGTDRNRLVAARAVVRRHHAGYPSLMTLEETIAWEALGGTDIDVDAQLRPALVALVEQDRRGIGRWAARALPRLPRSARRSVTAWQLAQLAGATVGATVSVEGPDRVGRGMVAEIAGSLAPARVGIRRVGDVVELGTTNAGAVAIETASTDPVLLELAAVDGGSKADVAIRAGEVERVVADWGRLTIADSTGRMWELEDERVLIDESLHDVVVSAPAGMSVEAELELDVLVGPHLVARTGPSRNRRPVASAEIGGRMFEVHYAPDADGQPIASHTTVPIGIIVRGRAGGDARAVHVVGSVREVRPDGISIVVARAAGSAERTIGAPLIAEGRLVGFVAQATRVDDGWLELSVVSLGGLVRDAIDTMSQRGVTARLLPARNGTAVLVSWGPATDRRHLLFDTGPRASGKVIADAVASATSPVDDAALGSDASHRQGDLELVVVSHFDDQAIGGLSAILAHPRIKIKELWLNRAGDEMMAGHPKLAGLGRGVPARIRDNVVIEPDDRPAPELLGGMRIVVLGPTSRAETSAYDRMLRSVTQESSAISPESEEDDDDERGRRAATDGEPRLTGGGSRAGRSGFGGDRTVANGASIALLIDVDGRSLLLPGDAPAETLTDALRRENARQRARRLRVDLFVLPHNGSRRNVTPELLELLDVGAFAVSTDGSIFRHPDKETIELVRRIHPNAQIFFNYAGPAERVRRELGWAIDDSLIVLPTDDEGGIEIGLD